MSWSKREHRMKEEHRRVQRKRPAELSYIELGTESGGIVWNASEEGAAFHAVAPVQQSGHLRVCISPNPQNRIELTGAVVWMDESKRFGGLQFTEVSAETRELIAGWLSQATAAEFSLEEFTLSRPGEEGSAGVSSGAERKGADEAGRAIGVSNDAPSASARDAAAPNHPRFDLKGAIFQRGSALHGPAPSLFRSPRARSVSICLLILALLFVSIALARSVRSGIGNSLIKLGEKLGGSNEVATGVPSVVAGGSTTSSQDPSVPAPSNGQIPDTTTLPVKSAPATPVQTSLAPSNSGKFHASKLRHAPHSLEDQHFDRTDSADAKQLWSAVGRGSISAEVALAQLYLRGKGVPRSCDQARVLLRAASKSGSLQAFQQLQNLRRNGCR